MHSSADETNKENVHGKDEALREAGKVVHVYRVELKFHNLSCAYVQNSSNETKLFRRCSVRTTEEDSMAHNARDTEVVLQGISGKICPGSLVALMGASGAGKSTLMDILAMRKTTGRLGGSVEVNGQARNRSFLSYSSYVPQEDLFVPTQTVWETMMYYANLRLPTHTKQEFKEERCKELLNELGLADTMSTRVGGPLPGGIHIKGLSGGQKRRLSICCGLVANPSILFLDEPTSGLDALSALLVMRSMRQLAAKNITVIATIHQPRAAIWKLFDQLMLLGSGRLLYMGPAKRAVPWFTETLGYPHDQEASAPDWLLDLTAINFQKDPQIFGGKTMRTIADIEYASEKFREAKTNDDSMVTKMTEDSSIDIPSRTDPLLKINCSKTDEIVDLEAQPEQSDPITPSSVLGTNKRRRDMHTTTQNAVAPLEVLQPSHTYEATWRQQFKTLLGRSMYNYIRNPGGLLARWFLAFATGLLAGLAFYDLNTTKESHSSRLGSLFFLAVIYILLPFASLSLFIYDRQFYTRERAAHLYSPSAYYISASLIELLINVFNVTCACIVSYWMIDYGLTINGSDGPSRAVHLLNFLIMVIMTHVTGSQVVQTCGLALPNQDLAFTVGAGYTILSMIFSGFLVRFEDLSVGIRWLQWISLLKYSYDGLATNEFKAYDETLPAGTPTVLEMADISSPGNVGIDIVALFIIYIVCHGISFLSLKYLYRERR